MFQLKNVLYLGWLGKGNVGDDVLFELFKRMFYHYSLLDRQKIAVNIDAYPIINHYKIDLSAYDLVVLGGGSIIHLSYWLKICEEAMKQSIPVATWGTGYDGLYKEDDEVSISIQSQNIAQFKEIYDQFSFISVRGPFTRKILTYSGVKREIHEIGDPALLYAPEIMGNQVQKIEREKRIIVNWGTAYQHVFGQNEIYVENELVKVIGTLITIGYKVDIYPIWIEDIEAVKRLTSKVNHPACKMYSVVNEAKILRKIIQKSYMSINFKLHANILSASTNTPFISLAYRGKCMDFAESIQCSDYTVSMDELTFTKVMKLFEDVNENYDTIVKRFEDAKTFYYPKLIHSVQQISNLLH